MHYIKIFLSFFVFFNAVFLTQTMASNNPTISMSHSPDPIVEGNSVTVTISISECPDTNDIKLTYRSQNATANSSDYRSVLGSITFSTGACRTSQTVTIGTYSDNEEETSETFLFEVTDNGTNTPLPGVENSSNQSFTPPADETITISDNTVTTPEGNTTEPPTEPPAEEAPGSATITKTISSAPSNPQIGDFITFEIRATNTGAKKKIQISDVFLNGADDWWPNSTAGAFSEPSIVSFASSVECWAEDTTNSHYTQTHKVFWCQSNDLFEIDQSFSAKVKVKLIKRGNVCNTANATGGENWTSFSSDTVCLEVTGNYPPEATTPADQTTIIGSDFHMSSEISAYVRDSDLPDETLTYNATGLPPGLSIDANTSKITGVTTALGEYTVTYTVTDRAGESASNSFLIKVLDIPFVATDNSYETPVGTPISGNFISDDTGNGIDTGKEIAYLSHTQPSEGTLIVHNDGSFTYTPDTGTSGTVTFNYTIQDALGQTQSATVDINIQTKIRSGYIDFQLINPPHTRNIIGNYVVTGNTVECVTSNLDTYNGTCTNNDTSNNNNYMTKYIDVDNDSSTWNSSSANFTLPESYVENGAEGILWAGLFWQGGIFNDYTGFPQRRAFLNNGSIDYIDITTDSALDLRSSDGKKIQIKIDTESTYTPIESSTFYYDNAHGTKGGYYAAYTDVTQLFKNKNLSKGEHTVTVSNLSANEGRDAAIGTYGGWALVIIYKEDYNHANVTPKNISIFNGYAALYDADDHRSKKLKISGFKLPKTGTVASKFSSFSGEGEKVYGAPADEYDRMTIQRTTESANSDMPGASNPANIFDAQLKGVERVNTKDNDVDNTNGIDIDTYDTSTIMTAYRDAYPDTNTSYIELSTNKDYITPSMMAFSAELYEPNVCYDYSMDIDGYILESSNNEIKTSYGSYGSDITTYVSIQSREGDFALHDVNLSYRINDITQLRYKTNSTAISPNGQYSYSPAGVTGLNQTYAQTSQGFGMYFGEGAHPQPDGPGGMIDAFETRYFKFKDTMIKSDVNTTFDLTMRFNVNYGSGKVTLEKNFNTLDICKDTTGYFPEWGAFNVSSADADAAGEPYNLNTQVAGRKFSARINSYKEDKKTPNETENTLEVELFNAGRFTRDTNLSCNNPDANITVPSFVRFDQVSSVPIEDIKIDKALKNVGFRIWYLTKADKSPVKHSCANRSDETCFQTLYSTVYTEDNYCQTECASGGHGCYKCLRTYYGNPVCSRDNFSIRPEAFVTTLIDSNQSTLITNPNLSIANSKSGAALSYNANLVSGYGYAFDVNATSYSSDDAIAGYIQTFNTPTLRSIAKMQWQPKNGRDTSKCNDTDDQNISLILFQGTSLNHKLQTMPTASVPQIGEYNLKIEDKDWTAVDWDPAFMTHHNAYGFDPTIKDCVPDNSDVNDETSTSQQGCLISNTHTHPRDGSTYRPLEVQYYPYTVNLTGLLTGAGSNNIANFVYINTMNEAFYPGGRDENMSFNVQGTFNMADYNNIQTSNFVDGCYADDVQMALWHTYRSTVPLNTPNLSFDLIDYNTSDPSIITLARRHGEFNQTTPLVQNTKAPLPSVHPKAAFAEDMKGAITMDMGVNYARTNNNPLNPRVINFSELNATLNASPDIHVNLKNDYKVFGTRTVDNNVTFFYGRAKPEQTLYDDVTEANISTPVSVVLYCDLGFAECQNRGVVAVFAQTSEFDWWKSWNHDSALHGNIAIASEPTTSLNKNSTFISQGEDSGIIASRGSLALPVTVPVNLLPYSLANMFNYTNRWLIYNPDSADTTPNPFYRVHFIGNSGWSGHGKTGHVVGGNSNLKKNRKMEW